MYSTISESDERLKKNESDIDQVNILKIHKGGRKNGQTNLSPTLRAIIGAAGEIDGNNKSVAEAFGVNPRSVANYRKGRKAHDAPIEPAAKADVDAIVGTHLPGVEGVPKSSITATSGSSVESSIEVASPKEQVVHKATSRLNALFADEGPISVHNINTLKPREAISAAKDLAAVIDRVTPKGPADGQRVQVNVFAPRMREESEYEAIDVTARDIT